MLTSRATVKTLKQQRVNEDDVDTGDDSSLVSSALAPSPLALASFLVDGVEAGGLPFVSGVSIFTRRPWPM